MGHAGRRRNLVIAASLVGMSWVFAPRAAQSEPVATPGQEIGYAMRPGESLIEVARMFHVRAEDIAGRNGIEDASKLRAGQLLAIPNPFAAEVAALDAERGDLLRHVHEQQSELSSLRATSAKTSAELERTLAEAASLRRALDTSADWRGVAVMLMVFISAALGWALSLWFDRTRIVRRSLMLQNENQLLAEARARYRSAAAQLELRYQKLYIDHSAHRGDRRLRAEDGTSALRRIFAEGVARIEGLIEQAERERTPDDSVATIENETRSLLASLNPLRLVLHRHWLGQRTS